MNLPLWIAAFCIAGSLSTSSLAEATASTSTPVLQKVGAAKLKVMFWEVYESTLYAPEGTFENDTRPLRLEICYLRDITSADLVKQTGKEWVAQGRDHPHSSQWRARLRDLWPDVSKDDVITLDITVDGASHFSFNGKPLGSISDADFGAQFSGIWLAPDTTRPKLRDALLGRTQ